jgi:hypothetical protein
MAQEALSLVPSPHPWGSRTGYEHIDEAARIEVLARARTLGEVVTAIDGHLAKLRERSAVMSDETIETLGDISRCARRAFQFLRLFRARLPLAEP